VNLIYKDCIGNKRHMRHMRHAAPKPQMPVNYQQLCFVCGTETPYGFGPPGWTVSFWACPKHFGDAEARRLGLRRVPEPPELPPFWPR
jgi:hypothetical protein